uniref:Zinc finger CCCH domain-containing protein 44 n=1 Tax=Noccaea caerulescens TaxID=107243 RepID=A0A1J3E9B6_NOCCA
MGEITWVEEGSNGHATGSRKRKVRPKRFQFVGWGSRQLIEFLQSLGKDTTNKISRFEVSETIARYIAENGLLDSSNKKKVACDDRLISLFGTRTILRIKVYDLLEKHYEENQDDSDFDYLYEDQPHIISHSEKIASRTRKVVQKKPRGTFAAIVSDNIKLLYLRKSLVQELVKSPENFEGKMLGSFVRIKSDPNDYLQNNPYQLVQVTGVKKEPGTDDFLLQVTNYMKDVSVSMLSDDNFSQEECEDLHQRIKNGSLKKPTIVEMEIKARSLHEDQTKHWLGREIVLLQRLISRANEKGLRRELSEYLEKRELLQNPEEQSRLLREVPEVIGEELVPNPEASPEDHKSDNEQRSSESTISSIQETPEVRRNLFGGEDQQCNGFLTSNPITTALYGMELNERLPTWAASADVEQPTNGIIGGETQTKESNVSELHSSNPNNGSQPQPNPSEIIELSDDDDEGDNDDGETVDPGVEDIQVMSYDKDKLDWFYKDPQGLIHGPYPLTLLKAWKDAEYFNDDFKVWMTGQSLESAVLLIDVLRGV